MSTILNILRAFFRLLAIAFIAVGATAFGFFVAVLVAGNGLAGKVLGQVWYQNDPFTQFLNTASLPLVGAIIERRIHPSLWDPVALSILGLPSWIALLVLTLFFAGVGFLILRLTRRTAR